MSLADNILKLLNFEAVPTFRLPNPVKIFNLAKEMLEEIIPVSLKTVEQENDKSEYVHKPLDGQDRVIIGQNYAKTPLWKLALGVPIIYAPIVTSIPFAAVAVWLVKKHLNMVGARNLKKYSDFLPDWVSHRYNYENQIVLKDTRTKYLAAICKTKTFWIFNCKMYCPLSVALFSYLAYLVKIVENWWCPFNHNKKHTYKDGAIDYSFWHIADEKNLLHKDDLNNAIWNQDAPSEN